MLIMRFWIIISVIEMIQINNNSDHISEASMKQFISEPDIVVSDKHFFHLMRNGKKKLHFLLAKSTESHKGASELIVSDGLRMKRSL